MTTDKDEPLNVGNPQLFTMRNDTAILSVQLHCYNITSAFPLVGVFLRPAPM
jgi:hypothetical protein